MNVSSGMGAINEMGGWSPGYRVSKAALNAMTRILATELEGRRRQGQLGLPGLVATDMGDQFGATKPVEDGASGVVWLATLPDDGPSGGFFRDGRQISFCVRSREARCRPSASRSGCRRRTPAA